MPLQGCLSGSPYSGSTALPGGVGSGPSGAANSSAAEPEWSRLFAARLQEVRDSHVFLPCSLDYLHVTVLDNAQSQRLFIHWQEEAWSGMLLDQLCQLQAAGTPKPDQELRDFRAVLENGSSGPLGTCPGPAHSCNAAYSQACLLAPLLALFQILHCALSQAAQKRCRSCTDFLVPQHVGICGASERAFTLLCLMSICFGNRHCSKGLQVQR